MKLGRTVILLLALAAAPAVRAQQPAPIGAVPTRAPQADPLMGNLFPPDLIMQNQDAIKLTDDQRQYIIKEIQRVQNLATSVQWRLQAAMERLGQTVHQDRPDEALAMAQLDSVLAQEREMKRAQIGLLIRLKDHLTPDQQAVLRQKMTPHQD